MDKSRCTTVCPMATFSCRCVNHFVRMLKRCWNGKTILTCCCNRAGHRNGRKMSRRRRCHCSTAKTRNQWPPARSNASDYAIKPFAPPVSNANVFVRNTDMDARSSILTVPVNTSHTIASTLTARLQAKWYGNSPALGITDATKAQEVAYYARELMLSGCVRGTGRLNGKAALVRTSVI